MGYRQLRLAIDGRSIVVAAIYDAWHKGNTGVELTHAGEQASVIASGPALSDAWTLRRPPDRQTPSTIVALRGGAELIGIGPEDKATE